MDTDDAGSTLHKIDTTTSTITNSAATTSTSTDPAQTDTPHSTISDIESTSQAKDKEKAVSGIIFSKPFLAAHSAYTKSLPHPEHDLIDQYGLTWLARTVARTDPTTGEKINKIRKSYEGQIKAFALAGRNKAAKWDPSQGHSIAQLAQAPAEDYHNSRVSGKEVSKGLSAAAQSRLQKILELTPGPVLRNVEWEHALGIDKTKGAPDEPRAKKPDAPPREQHNTTTAPANPNVKINGHINGTMSTKDAADMHRPKRAGKRRRYHDDAFEGYGEGYDDEDDNSSEGSRRSIGSRQKRQKVTSFGQP